MTYFNKRIASAVVRLAAPAVTHSTASAVLHRPG